MATTGGDGLVHAVDGGGRAAPSGLAPADFAAAAVGRTIRVVALRANVPLICAAYRRAAAGTVVELGRPAGVDWAGLARRGVHDLLATMGAGSANAASRGGWRALTGLEYPTYAIADHLARGGGDGPALAGLMEGHPAAPGLAFLPHLDRVACAALLATILDPRWYVDAARPDRSGRLKCHLGLIGGGGSRGRAGRRALVLAAWKTTPGVPAPWACPGYFLWRHWAAGAGTAEQADLRTSRRFVAYLRATWLDGLLGDSWCPDRLFVPEYFFADAADAAAYRASVAARPGAAPARV